MTDHAIRIEQTGGPEVMAWAEIEVPAPGRGELLIRHTAVGLNFIDTYHRTGLYPVQLPSGLGGEAAGVVEAVGEGVAGYRPGDRIGYCWGPIGAYATRRTIPADLVVPLPVGIADDVAAAALLKGLTAEYLIERCGRVQPGWWVVNHAAAGGVGTIASQWLKAVGAVVIGTVGSEDKIDLARRTGCDHVLLTSDPAWPDQVRELTGGAGVPLVLDGIGKATWEGSLKALAKRGLLASFGNASGPVSQIEPGILARMGSLFLTRPTLYDYYITRQEKEAGSSRLFGLIAEGKIRIEIGQRYPLKEAAQAHRDLEGRKTTGSTVLVP